MSDGFDEARALLALRRTRAKLDAREREPIAIVGMACRLPGGVDSPASYWDLLAAGRDAIAEIPPGRWDAAALYDPDLDARGKMATRWGGFVDAPELFDAAFFGISPLEARLLDPQQRIALEVAWEAIHDAGLSAALPGSATGVFLGSFTAEWGRASMRDLSTIETYSTTGALQTFIPNRISFALDLKGPSVVVDTACSASLVAVHLAAQSLRARECDAALAGGVNFIFSPDITVGLSRLGALSPTGRCKTFDATADGFVRSEGCGIVVLRRLSDAVRDGDRIWAVIKGSAVNHDGRNAGLTVPNGQAQEDVIRRALAAAQVAPADVAYVEAHGTGTVLGDPIEVAALGAVLSEGRGADRTLAIGSVKSNLGHLETAAGVASLIKAVLAIHHRRLPASLHFATPNPHIPFARLPLRVQTELGPWPSWAGPLVCGVSSFGMGGTNAHVVVGEPPEVARAVARAALEGPHVLLVSGHTEAARTAHARAFEAFIAADDAPDFADLCATAATRAAHLDHRLAVVAADAAVARERLGELLAGREPPGVVTGRRAPSPRVAFVFSGQGPQWPGMGAELAQVTVVVRETIETIDALVRRAAGWSLIHALETAEGETRLFDTEVAQPAIFALQVALARLYRAWGVEPFAVVGHSVGEIAAAHVAGVLDLETATRLVVARGRIMQETAGRGRMISAALSEAEAEALALRHPGRLAVAAVNGPASSVLSGDDAAITAALAALAERGIPARELRGRFAFHSQVMDELVEPLSLAFGDVPTTNVGVLVASTMTGRCESGESFDGTYWAHQVRRPVLFASAVRSLLEQGAGIFLELAPHPVLTPSVLEIGHGRRVVATGALRRGVSERETVLEALGALHCAGAPVGWAKMLLGGTRVVSLPRYPWQRERHWYRDDATDPVEAPAAPAARGAARRSLVVGAEGYALAQRRPKAIESLDLVAAPRPRPGPGEVLIRVRASGLNWRDVLMALGLYPGVGDLERAPIGAECAGVVEEVGEGALGLAAGDEVIACTGAGAFDAYVVAPRGLVVTKPPELSFEDAAAIPVVFLTAFFALDRMAHLRAGERVLIHAAAGGVGLAALDYALGRGAEVYATAGTEAKRALVLARGAHQVFDSRSLAWADEVLARSGGRGVDVVLSAIQGEGMRRGLGVLAPFGRFVEIGMGDVYDDASLPLGALRKSITVSAFALGELLARPSEAGPVLAEVVEHVRSGAVRALPRTEFSVSRLADAFEYMTRREHTGKIVLRAEDAVSVAVIDPARALPERVRALEASLARPAPPPPAPAPAPAPPPVAPGGPAGIGDALRAVVAKVLRLPPGRLDAGAPLLQQGVDSLSAVRIAQALEQATGRVVPAAAFLRDEPLEALAARLGGGAPAPPSLPAPDAPRPPRYDVKEAFGAIARIHVARDPASPGTRAALEAITLRYTARTRRSKEFAERYRGTMADPRAVSGFRPATKELAYPIVVDRSRGPRVWDLDGNAYVDVLNGFGMSLFGWQPDFVREAIHAQVDRGYEIGPQHPLAGEVAELFSGITGSERTAFCNTGSEAVLGAIRIARTVTGRSTICVFAGSYHGIFDEVIVRKGTEHRAVPAAPGIMPASSGNVLVLDYGTPESLDVLRARAGDLAAVVVEPVQSRRPELVPIAFLRELRRITEAAGACLVFDEVITGLRTHARGAQGLFGVEADLATYGKVVGGGFPIGVVAGKRRFMDALDGGAWRFGDDSAPTAAVTYFAGTFVRHPLALAAARAQLFRIKELGPALQEGLTARAQAMVSAINAGLERAGAPLVLTSFGSLFRHVATEDVPFGELLYVLLRERGVHVVEGFPCFLTTAHGDEEVAHVVAAYEGAVAEMQDAGFYPRGAAAPRAHAPERIPLSEGQRALWLLHRLAPRSAAYNLHFALRVRGPLDVDALRAAFQTIADRHAVLRARFVEEDGVPWQRIEEGPIDFEVEGTSADLAARVAGEVARPFDLASGRPFRVRVLQVAPDEHVLVFVEHHAVGDTWSLVLVLRELGALYPAIRDRAPAPELPAPGAYRDHVTREAEALEDARLPAFWERALRGAPAALELPTDRPRPPVQTYAGAARAVELAPDVVLDVARVARAEGTTPYVLLLAAWAAVLARAAGATDLVVGTTVSGRGRAADQGTVGYFVQVLPIRIDASGAPSLKVLLRRARDAFLGAMEHADYPLARIVERLGIARDAARSPLVQVLFTLDQPLIETDDDRRALVALGAASGAADLGGLRLEAYPVPHAHAQLDLDLELVQADGRVTGRLAYNTDLFDDGTAERLAAAFVDLVARACRAPDRPLRALLPAAEAAAPGPALGACPPLLALLDAAVDRAPERAALVDGASTISYASLDAAANALAARLRALGVGPGARVAIALPRGSAVVVAMIATLKAGGAYVPLDLAYPAERLAFVLEDAGARVVVTTAAIAPRFAPIAVAIDEALPSAPRPPRADAPGEAAYVLYTSGSTGTPKGVVVTHANLASFLAAMTERLGDGAPGVWLAVTTVSFDISVLELLWTLTRGFTVVLHAEREAAAVHVTGGGGHGLPALVLAHDVTHLQCTPSRARMLLDEPGADAALARLRALLVGGEAFPPALAAELRRAVSGRLLNMYGPTETTVWSAVHELPPSWEGDSVPIGHAIAGTVLHVCDRELDLVPPGTPGELLIGGPGVARGYHARAALTAERFIPDPFGGGGRLYRTGDLVRRRKDGALEFLGRIDGQVKIRGHRVELGEVEAVLAREPGVRQVAVRVWDANLVAYVVGSGEALGAGLRARAERSLPPYMVPAAFVFLDALPETPNGKIDRNALPPPSFADGAAAHVPPRGPAEVAIAGAFAELLSPGRAVGAHDDFFALGGHSLVATRLLARLRASLDADLPLEAVFEARTVARLAARASARGRAAPLAPIPRRPGRARAPLSFAQQRLWFIAELDPGAPTYNIAIVLRLRGALDRDALARAIDAVVARHGVLRARFEADGGDPVQVIRDRVPSPLTFADLRAEGDPEAAARREAVAEASRPFDLGSDLLLRTRLLRVGEAAHALLVTVHHAVADGWSLGILLRELGALYSGASLPPLELAYVDYAAWQREALGGAALDADVAWWKEALAGAPPVLALRTDRPRRPFRSGTGGRRGGRVEIDLGDDVSRAIAARAQELHATPFMVLLAAFGVLLSRWSGERDVVVGTPIANRLRPELEPLIGCFVNVLALRVRLDGDPSFAELVQRVKATTLGAYDHQDFPFERLVDLLQPPRDLGATPIFQVQLVLQDAPMDALAAGGGGLAITLERPPWSAAQFDLNHEIVARAGRYRSEIEYAKDLFDAPTVEAFAEEWRALLRELLLYPDARVSGARVPAAPAPAPALPFTSDEGREEHEVRVPPQTWERFRARAAAAGIAPRSALVAALVLVLARFGATAPFSIGVADGDALSLLETPAIDLARWGGFASLAASIDRAAGARRIGSASVVFRDASSRARGASLDHAYAIEDGALVVRWSGALAAPLFAGLRDAHRRLLEASWTDPALGWDPSFRPPEPAPTARREIGPRIDDPWRVAASRAPAAPALLGPAGVVTHGWLVARATRTASALAALGVGPGDLVGVAAPKGHAQIAATLGVSRSGAGYVPIEPSWPAARIASVCARAAIGHVLVAEGSGVVLPDDVTAHPIDLGEAGGACEAASRAPAADDLAYAIFTSGSTGQPKGVAIEHRQARVTLDDMAERFPLGPSDRVLALSALSFDLSVYDVFGVLAAGGALVVPDDARQRDASHWVELIAEHQVTVWNTAPALLEMLVVYAEIDPAAARRALASLRLVLLSGDWIPVTLPGRLRALAPGARLVSLGGATEGAIWSIVYPVDEVDPGWTSVPYGRALRGQAFVVLDPDGRPCPVLAAGELVIVGDGVARGYVGDPDETARRFGAHPVLGRRFYRTGDLGRFRPDGVIEFLGRLDRQVKIRGHRIELAEIEAVLARAPGVRQAVALVVKGALVAYVAPSDPAAPPPDDALALALRRALPDYMVPSRFVRLDALPVSDNGKVDLARLPDPEAREREDADAPRGPIEIALAGIWRSVLGVPVSRGRSFFELGGHSLLATQMISRIRRSFGVDLPLQALFDAPTVAALAARLTERTWGEPPPPIARLPASAGAEVPLSFAQERIWFLGELAPDHSFYNMRGAVRFRGPLDAALVERSLRLLVARHDALRARFRSDGGRAVQTLGAAPDLRLARADASSERDPLARALAIARDEAAAPFALDRDLLVRALLTRIGEDDHLLSLTVHHIVADGWSVGILLEELAIAYAAFRDGRAPALDALPIRYADFAAWQRGWLSGEVVERQIDYWRRRLEGAPLAIDLPADRRRPPVQSFRGGYLAWSIPARVHASLLALARAEGATLFMVLLAGLAATLARWTGEEELVLGTLVAGRGREEVERLVGCFINLLALRVGARRDLTVRACIAGAREAALGAFAREDLPFERLLEALRLPRDMSRTPVFQVLLALHARLGARPSIGGLAIEEVEIHTGVSIFDLRIDLEERDDGLAGGFEYATDLFDEDTVLRLAGHYLRVLEAMAERPDAALGALPILGDDERARLLVEWNRTRVDAPFRSVVERFAEAARRSPGREAVRFEGRSLTYAELDRRSEDLARWLRARGVGAEDLVGLCLERSAEMVVAVLGVLRAGAAWLPLDPTYPPERLAHMREDAAAQVVLTREVLEDEAALAGAPRRALPAVRPEQLAYVIYTSGSTGRPKGAMNVHAGLANRIAWMQSAHPLAEGDVVLHKTPFSFDVSVWELVWAWTVGATIVVAPPEAHKDPAALGRLIEAERVTTIHFVPSMLAVFLESPGAARATGLRRVIASGEALSPELERRFFERLPGVELHNLYGPTEASIDVTSWRCEAGSARGTVPIGRPIDNVRTYVLDPDLAPVPIGAAGELYLGGAGVGRGYWRRPALTADRFVPDPFADTPGARLYRTGDRARVAKDGAIEYLGRLDHQVKLRGFRIELGEIEARLEEDPAVERATAIVEDERIVAYVVPRVEEEARACAALEASRIEGWRTIYEETYAGVGDGDDDRDLAGWTESATGAPIPAPEMRAFVRATADAVLARRPRRVLEIGCGNGLVALAIAPHVETYVGTDISAAGLAALARRRGGLPIELRRQAADDAAGIAPGGFDVVVLASVVQYFPSLSYLLRALEVAVRATADGGVVLVRDVRSLPLLAAFHAAAGARDVARAISLEEELALDPRLFVGLGASLPRIGDVAVTLERGWADNELSRYRYDVALAVGPAAPSTAPAWEDWRGSGLTVARLGAELRARPGVRCLARVPNARLDRSPGAVHPEALHDLAREVGLELEASAARGDPDGAFDAIFRPRGAPVVREAPGETPGPLATEPLRGEARRRIAARLGEALARSLPEVGSSRVDLQACKLEYSIVSPK